MPENRAIHTALADFHNRNNNLYHQCMASVANEALIAAFHETDSVDSPEYNEWLSIWVWHTEASYQGVPAKELSAIFDHHNCYRCHNGERPCVAGHPRRCVSPQCR